MGCDDGPDIFDRAHPHVIPEFDIPSLRRRIGELEKQINGLEMQVRRLVKIAVLLETDPWVFPVRIRKRMRVLLSTDISEEV